MRPIAQTELSPTLTISECRDGFWLYDETRGMNLAMRAKTRDAAFTEALTYYQIRLESVEKQHSELQARVDAFVGQFTEENEG